MSYDLFINNYSDMVRSSIIPIKKSLYCGITRTRVGFTNIIEPSRTNNIATRELGITGVFKFENCKFVNCHFTVSNVIN
jgi:hypothetical protein